MKKFIYLCGIMLLSINMMAQIDLYDRNWNAVLIEDFDQGASYWQWDTLRFLNLGDYSWKSYIGGTIAPSGEHEVYQYNNCQINAADHTMHLVAYYDSIHIHDSIYKLPKFMLPDHYPHTDSTFYFSGALEYYKERYPHNSDERKFRYGYFEIRCKLPVHQGAFPTFWLQSSCDTCANKFYEEIDVFEYSWWITSPSGPNPDPPGTGSKRCFTCGIYFNDKENNSDGHSYGRAYPLLPSSSSDLDEFHTYSCEWMPDHVIWYFDGIVLNEYTNMDSIPHRPLELIANYAIDKYCFHSNSTWFGPDEMLIDYINVVQLKWECDNIETITSQNDLDNFDYAVKKSISITSLVEEPVVKHNDKITFRVTDSFEVTSPFEVEEGAEFTVIMQSCPPSI